MKMRKALAWIATVAMLLTAFSGLTMTASAATLSTKTYNMTQFEGFYQTQGRVLKTVNASTGVAVLGLDAAASGFEFYYYGKGTVSITMDVTFATGTTCYFSAFVDGVEQNRIAVARGDGNSYQMDIEVTIAQALSEGYHHVEFYKQNEAKKFYINVKAVTLTGYPLAPPAADPVILEVVGDSISGGSDTYISAEQYGNNQSGWDVHQNGLESYGYKTAKKIGAEFRVVQASGYGLVCNYKGDTTQNVPSLYAYTNYFRDQTREYDFDPAADIVVVNLGTNDYLANDQGVSKRVDGNAFKNAVKTFSGEVRRLNPECKIVWCTGMRESYYKAEMMSAVSELDGEANGYFFCELPQGASAGTHPNPDEHTAAAEVLAEFLKVNCLPEGYATVASTATLQAKINEAQNAPFTSPALTEAIKAAQMELAVNTTDEFRLGTRVDAIETALRGETMGQSYMPNEKYSTYDVENKNGHDHVVVPTYNSDGSVKLVKQGQSEYWPRVDTNINYAWNVKETPYVRVETMGASHWNLEIKYWDKNGKEQKVQMDDIGNGGQDFLATSTRQVVAVDMGSAILAEDHANSDGFVHIFKVRFYLFGANGVYLTLYDCSFTESNGTTWSGASDAASYISSANAVYVRKNNATLSGTIPSGAKVYTETGVNTLTFNGLTMSGATPAFTVKSNVKIKLTGTSTVTASTQFSGGTPTYIGTGVLKNGSDVVMRKGDLDSSGEVDSSDIRAMMNHCAGIATLSAANLAKADTEGDNAIDTRDVRRFLDTVVA